MTVVVFARFLRAKAATAFSAS